MDYVILSISLDTNPKIVSYIYSVEKKNLLKKSLSLIPQALHRKGLAVIGLLIVSAFLDLFSLAAFVPIIYMVINPPGFSENVYIKTLQQIINVSDPSQLAIFLTVAAIFFILIKTRINAWIAFKKAAYAYRVAENIAARAMDKFLSISYHDFTHIDHTKEMNRLTDLPLSFANNILIPLGTIFAECSVATLLLISIGLYDKGVFLFLLIIGAPLAIWFRIKKTQLKNTSGQIKNTYPSLLKHTLQSIEGFLEIRSYQRESFFSQRFNKTFQKLGGIFSSDHAQSTSTARTTELLAALTIGALIIYMLLIGKSNQDTLFILSLYAGSSFRIIPSLNRIFASIMQIRTREYVVDELQLWFGRNESVPKHSDKVIAPDFNEKIELGKITFGYEGQPLILNNASLTIKKGEKIILSGKSGVGKTTLFLILMRFLKQQSGEIWIDGKSVSEVELNSIRKYFGFVSQNPYILDASIADNIAFGISQSEINAEKIKKIISSLDLEAWINNLPEKIDTIIGEKGTRISGGQRQRIAIARALYHDAEIFLLDEVTNQLDPQTEREVIQAIKVLAEQRKTIILITHKIGFFENFDSVYELKDKGFVNIGEPVSAN